MHTLLDHEIGNTFVDFNLVVSLQVGVKQLSLPMGMNGWLQTLLIYLN